MAPRGAFGGLSPSLARLLSVAVLVAMPASAGAQDASIEYAVKANYLYKFASFVGWPETAFPSAQSPFVLCVAGGDPFGPALEQAVRGQSVDQHPAVIRRLKDSDSAAGCHILFAGGSGARPAVDTVRSVRGAPVLTVSDQSRGASGAIIQFAVQNNRVRFTIDAEAAAVNRVIISSKLLSLAISVKPGGRS
ncbi:MAG TPA: YfiR family protein [Caulobacteraceae bacterium]|jgi:hypothetical protein|nr:YfiR family protein [Caulobacteraceae bacterium]